MNNKLRNMIENVPPFTEISSIIHDGTPPPPAPPEKVGTCAIVDRGTPDFRFEIIAKHVNGHLKSYLLYTVWGDNEYGGIYVEDYSSHVSPTRKWFGVDPAVVPPTTTLPWKATGKGTRCAHTFELHAWGRSIDGERPLHHSRYTKSITIYLV